jgi:ABC-type glycerol-3-phosphate transport system substrate-binding protein
MFKRSSLIGMALFLLTVAMVFSVSLVNIAAQDATPAPTPTAIVSELGTGGTHLSFWNGLTGSDGATMTSMLADFIADHPEISVTMEVIPWDNLYTKLRQPS